MAITTLTGTTDPACERCERTITPPERPGIFIVRRFHVDRLVPTYWGTRLCPDCCVTVASCHDMLGDWPPLPDAHAAG